MKGSYPQVNVERWGVHVEAALASGQSLSAYAREQGLSVATLYAARALMRGGKKRPKRLGTRASTRRSSSRKVAAFVPVAVRPGLMVAAHLPNGVQLRCELADEASLRSLLGQLAELPCSV
jgi:hypothetical protein